MCKKGDLMVKLAEAGWTLDQWGHMKKGKYRVKFQSISIRIEIQIEYPATAWSKSSKEWVSRLNAYLKDVEITQEGLRINGRTLNLMPQREVESCA